MYKYFLLIALILCSFSVSAQWQQTGSKVRYVTGIGIPTKDTAAGVAADSSQILIRPADSSLYVKYKRTWMRVGGGGGSIAGSGTTNYIPKFTSSSAIGNSQIFDNGTRVGIGYGGASAYKFGVQFSQSSNTVDGFILTSSTLSKSYAIWAANAIGGSLWGLSNPYTGFINYTSGDATSYINDGGGYFSWHNSTAELMRLTNAGNVGLGTITPTAKFDVNGVIKNNDRILANANNANGTAAINTFFNNSTIAQFCNFTNVASATQYGYMQGSDGTNYIGGSKNVFEYGNVGIGTTSPSEKLHLVGNTLRQNDASNSFGYTISTTSATTTLATLFGGSSFGIRTGGSGSDNMRITSGGNLLIGTTTDNGTDKLQVNGSMNVSTLATTNNLSVTTNATVGGNLTTGSINATSGSIAILSGSTFSPSQLNSNSINNSSLITTKGLSAAYTNISATYTTTYNDYLINITSGTFTLNFVSAVTYPGLIQVIKNSGTGTVTLDPSGTQTIDGNTTVTMNVQNQTYVLMSDGSNWKIISKYL